MLRKAALSGCCQRSLVRMSPRWGRTLQIGRLVENTQCGSHPDYLKQVPRSTPIARVLPFPAIPAENSKEGAGGQTRAAEPPNPQHCVQQQYGRTCFSCSATSTAGASMTADQLLAKPFHCCLIHFINSSSFFNNFLSY